MKVYLVTPKEYDFDYYRAIAVIALNKDKAIEMCKKYFEKSQFPLKATKIPKTKETIIIEDFMNG